VAARPEKVITLIVVVGVLSLIPLIPFTVPRLFTGTEANYFYVSPLTMLKDVARFFSMGVTVDFSQTGIQLLAATAVGFVLLGLYAARTWQRRLFLLAYLLAVVAGLMVGSLLFKPMYQGVRHIMVGSPAFLLLMAWGVLFAWEQSRRETAVRYVWAVVGGVGLLSAFLGPFIALNNLYNQHEIYAKDDFRALIAQMEALAGDNDVIVYNNAIHLPLHEHYQTRFDIAVTAVPSYPSLASDTAVTELLRLAETYDRIWFVTDPPADHRDDDHLAQQWLAANLVQVARNQAHARTTVVESLTFNTAPVQVEALPENGRSLDIHWPSLPALRGVALDSVALDGAQPITQAALWFDLFWDAAPSAPDVPLNFRLQDPTGKEWLNNIQPLWTGSASPWPTSGLSRQPYQLILPTGLPPGSYTLFAQPLLADSITPMGDAYPILDLETGAGAGMPVAHWPKNHHIRFDNGLQLLGWETGDIEVRPGHTLPLTLYWQADRPVAPEALSYELAVIAPDGTLERSQSDSPGANGLAEWPLGVPIRQQTGLYFRPETEPGRYQLRWQLRQGDEVVAGRPLGRPWSTGSIILGEVTVIPWPLETDLPTDVERSATTFGPINLYGYRVDASQPNQITLDLVWQAQTEPEVNFLLFVHLVDEADNIVAQVDRLPGNTLRPTNGWRQGEVITDTLTLNLPPDLPAGAYHIRVGFFDPDTGERLPAADEGAPQANDQAQITTVTMP
jgi:hypothetical protein